jgi:hypothetical protein
MNVQRTLAFLTETLGWRSAVVLLAALTAVWQLATPTQLPVSALAPGPPTAAPAAADPVAQVAPAYPAIPEHPLFYPTRQPWVPPPPKAAPPALPAPAPTAVHPLQKYQLVGIVISEGGKTVAISEGQQLNGWTLREISRDAAHFESAGDAYDLKFPTPRWPRS